MAKVGEITFNKTEDGRAYAVGVVSLAGYKGRVYFVPNTDKGSDKAPDWLICEPKVPGTDFRAEIGSAWNRNGRETGREYVDCYFNGPSFAQPVGNIRAFERDKGEAPGGWDLVYQRPDPSKASKPQGTGAASNGGDDEIPF